MASRSLGIAGALLIAACAAPDAGTPSTGPPDTAAITTELPTTTGLQTSTGVPTTTGVPTNTEGAAVTAGEPSAASAVLANYAAQLDAMRAGDTTALAALLTDDFTLTHITGYRQPKAQWLSEMDKGQFRYHSVEQLGDPVVEVTGETATLTHRIITDATVYGSRNRWRLAFTQS